MPIPLVDLRSQYLAIKHEIMAAFEEVLENMQLFLGPQLQAFESEFAAYCECHHAVGVASGTDALALALRACNIGPGDEVITVSNTFIATVEAIALVGATPVFVDIDPLTYTMDWRQLDRVLTSRTRAIIPVHLYGHPTERLQELKIEAPFVQPWGTHVYCYHVIQVQGRDHFRTVLEQAGIAAGIHYPTPVHLRPACAHFGYMRGMLPVTETVSDRIVSLPMCPELTAEQRQSVVDAVKKSILSEVSSE